MEKENINHYKNKIAYLISLLMQLKAYAPQKVNEVLFLDYLNVNISLCEKILELLQERTSN